MNLITLGQEELLEAAENLKIAWNLADSVDNEALSCLISQYIQLWLEDLCSHPDFFFQDQSRFKQDLAKLEEEVSQIAIAA